MLHSVTWRAFTTQPIQLQEEAGDQVEVLDAAAADKGTSGSQAGRKVDPSQRVTTRYMTKYEKARILGTRALQLRYVFYGTSFPVLLYHPWCDRHASNSCLAPARVSLAV